jgi:erythronate-4-phosphate dehydrogenase
MITALADKYIYHINKFLPDDTELTLFDSNTPLKHIPDGTQALLIRTVTKINPGAFPALPKSLEFIGTASSGIDHVDKTYLQKNDIAFADAAGCNARSVAEYVAVALLLWAKERKLALSDLSIGIIGVGHAGSAVQKMLQKLGMQTIGYDPPRQEQDPSFQSASLQEVLRADILTFHTPLTHQTVNPTHHWLDEEKLQQHSFKLIINAARGGVVDEQALVEACRTRSVEQYVLDVWENEPDFNDEAARHAFIKTPHIAGYSVQAKERASRMMAKALADHFNIEAAIPAVTDAPQQGNQSPSTFWSLPDMLTFYHPIRDYETRFRMLIGRAAAGKMEGFNRLRSTHPLRNEFPALSFPDDVKHAAVLKKLAEPITGISL